MSRETYSQIRFRNCTSWTKRQKIGPNLLLKLGNCSFPLSKKLYLKSQTGIDFMVERIEIWAPVKLLPLEVRPPVRSTRHHLPGDQIRPAQRVATRRGFRLLQLDAAARRGGGRRQVDAAAWLARGGLACSRLLLRRTAGLRLRWQGKARAVSIWWGWARGWGAPDPRERQRVGRGASTGRAGCLLLLEMAPMPSRPVTTARSSR